MGGASAILMRRWKDKKWDLTAVYANRIAGGDGAVKFVPDIHWTCHIGASSSKKIKRRKNAKQPETWINGTLSPVLLSNLPFASIIKKNHIMNAVRTFLGPLWAIR